MGRSGTPESQTPTGLARGAALTASLAPLFMPFASHDPRRLGDHLLDEFSPRYCLSHGVLDDRPRRRGVLALLEQRRDADAVTEPERLARARYALRPGVHDESDPRVQGRVGDQWTGALAAPVPDARRELGRRRLQSRERYAVVRDGVLRRR